MVETKLLFENNTDTTLQFIWEIFDEEWNYAGGGISHKETSKINVDFINMNDSVVLFRTPLSLKAQYQDLCECKRL